MLSGGSFDSPAKASYTMKMVKSTSSAASQQTNGSPERVDDYIGEGEDHTASFDLADTVDLNVNNTHMGTSLNNGT